MYHKRERVPASFQGLHSIHQRTTTQPKNGAPFASIRATKRDKFVNTWKGWHILYLLLHFLERNRFSFNNLHHWLTLFIPYSRYPYPTKFIWICWKKIYFSSILCLHSFCFYKRGDDVPFSIIIIIQILWNLCFFIYLSSQQRIILGIIHSTIFS